MAETPTTGQIFDFDGLPGDDDPGPEEERVIEILGISVAGSVQFRITLPAAPDLGPGLHSAPLSEVLLLIERGVWIERPA